MAVRPDTTTKKAAPIPASSDADLEQYGVWIKAEPQDILEESEAVPPAASDFDLPEETPSSMSGTFLTEDEEKLLGSFEELGAEGLAGSEEFNPGIPDVEGLPPLEDFELPSEEETGTEIEELGASTIDISLDDLDARPEILPDTPIDMSTVKGLGSEAPKPAEAESAGKKPLEEAVIEDVSAEFLDMGEEGAQAAGQGTDVTAEFLGTEEFHPAPAASPEPEPEFESIDMDLHFDDTLPGGQGGAFSGEPGFEAVSEFDDFLQETERKEEPAFSPERFDDVSAVEKDLAEPSPEPPQAHRRPTAPVPSETSLQTDLLSKIAEELSSIRNELVTLKSQIGAMKIEVMEAQPAAEPEERKQQPAGGFFDEEEDETIALTGDELDNILNTADFTEENAEAPSELIEETILPESGEYLQQAEEPAIEEIRLEPSAMASEAIEEEPISDIEMLAEEGGRHLTPAPEDTSYLEEPLPNEEPLDLSEIPLHEESLADEASLDLNMEPEDVEPLPEIVEELPVVEGASEPSLSPEILEDITLGMPTSAEYAEEPIAEVEAAEPLPEIEEMDFGEINLAEEKESGPYEEVEELSPIEEELTPFEMHEAEEAELEARIAEKTVKPAEPVRLHPDEIPTSLDDSFFVGSPSEVSAEPVEELPGIEELAPAAEPETGISLKEAPVPAPKGSDTDRLKDEIRGVLSYLDKLLESLPESKIDEFAHSEYFDTYKKLFEELGLV